MAGYIPCPSLLSSLCGACVCVCGRGVCPTSSHDPPRARGSGAQCGSEGGREDPGDDVLAVW